MGRLKNIFRNFVLITLLFLAGCRDMCIDINCYETIPVSFGPAGAASATKAAPYSDQSTGGLDANVANYMLFIFKSDGNLFDREFVSGNSSVVKYVYRNVEYHIYAVANLDTSSSLYSRLNAVTTESGFLDVSYKFSDAWQSGKGWLAKTGQVVKTFTSDSGTAALKLDRVVAMIRVTQLGFEAADPEDVEWYYSIDGIYLINTVNEMTFGGTALHYTNCSVAPDSDFISSPDWSGPPVEEIDFSAEYRNSSLDYYLWCDPLPNYCYFDGSGWTLDIDPEMGVVYIMYCLANPMTTTTYGCLDPMSDTPRQTRLVVSLCDDNGPTFACYPMTVKSSDGTLKANMCYNVAGVIDLDSIGDVESRTCVDGMDWDAGSMGFYLYLSGWQNGGTYSETL